MYKVYGHIKVIEWFNSMNIRLGSSFPRSRVADKSFFLFQARSMGMISAYVCYCIVQELLWSTVMKISAM